MTKRMLILAALTTGALVGCTGGNEPTGTTGDTNSLPATTLPLPSTSNVGNSATTPIPVADIEIPEGLLGIDYDGDLIEYVDGTWEVRYDGPAYDTPDQEVQSWVTGGVRVGDTVYVSMCCEPVVGITIDTATGEAPYYGEIRAADDSGRIAVVDLTSGVRIHDTATGETVEEISFSELTGETAATELISTLDVRFADDGSLYIAIVSDNVETSGIYHLAAGSQVGSISELVKLWTPPTDDQGYFEIASVRNQSVGSDGLWVRYGLSQPTLTRVKPEAVATMPVIISLPESWSTDEWRTIVVIDETAIAGSGTGIELYRIADRAGAAIDNPQLFWIG